MVALEDFKPEAGPTFFIPGTHTLSTWESAAVGLFDAPLITGWTEGVDFNISEYVRTARNCQRCENATYHSYARNLQRIVDERGWKRHAAQLRTGDVLVWASTTIHGSQPVHDTNSTRLSMSAHYVDVAQDEWWNPRATLENNKFISYGVPGSGGGRPSLSLQFANRVSDCYLRHLKRKHGHSEHDQKHAHCVALG